MQSSDWIIVAGSFSLLISIWFWRTDRFSMKRKLVLKALADACARRSEKIYFIP